MASVNAVIANPACLLPNAGAKTPPSDGAKSPV
jgi:hypothetical protein